VSATFGYPCCVNANLKQFYEFGGGSVFQVAANLNGVTYNPQTPIASPADTGSGSMATSVPLSAASPLSLPFWSGHWVAFLSVVAGVTLFSERVV